MMDSRELRIGNFINFEGPKKITQIIKDNDVYYLSITDSSEEKNIEVKSANPCYLTETILMEWCGFSFKQPYYSKGDFKIRMNSRDSFVLATCERFTPWIDSLHQLQNLYFALKCEELGIRLSQL